VQRHPSGYIYANYFNTTPNDVATGSVTKVCVETANDGFIRHGDAAAIRSFLNVESGATADQTAAQLLTAVKTVDGAGSGLDADLLDGVQLSGLVQRDFQDTGRNLNITSNASGSAGLFMKSNANDFRFQLYGDGSNYGFLDSDWGGWDIQKTQNGAFKVDEGSGLKRVWNEGNDGAGSGLDADTVDGLQASQFLRSDTADAMAADLSFGSGANIHRATHSSGYLVGGYNNIGTSDTKSSPIYAIGTNYQPSDTDLDNMYGIGYTNSAAAYDGLDTVCDGWGMYVAAGGVARVGLSGTTGRIYGTSVVATGTITAGSFSGDGSALTGVGGSTTAGAVGTYAFLFSFATVLNPGTNVGGGSLRYGAVSGANASNNSGHSVTNAGGTAPSGTWQCMGQKASGYYTYPATLFVRIS
jgi:hypothetical protein